MPNGRDSQLETYPREILPDVDFEDVLTRVSTKYDDLLQTEDEKIRYYFDQIRLYIALSTGSLSLPDVYAGLRYIDTHPEATVGQVGRTLYPWNEELIEQLVDNIKLLKKSNLLTADHVYNAIRDALTFQHPHIPPDGSLLKLFSYIVRNPLAPLSHASRELGTSRSSLETVYQQLRKLYRILSLGFMEYSSFGLRSCAIFFELRKDVVWETLRDQILKFPFIKVLHTDVNMDRGFVSFTLPDNPSNLKKFTKSVEEISPEFFEYSSYHIINGGGRFMNPGLIEQQRFSLPASLDSEDRFEQESSIGRCFDAKADGFKDGLTLDDFRVAESHNLDLRMKPSEVSERMSAQGWALEPRQITYRKNKLIELDAMHPWVWFSRLGLHYNICVEIVCNSEWCTKLINTFSYFPDVFYYTSERGAVFWIETPMYHLVKYNNFLQNLISYDGIDVVHPIFTIYRSGGRTLMQVFENYEFGKKGFSFASSDVSLSDYLL